MKETPAQTLLTEGIRNNFAKLSVERQEIQISAENVICKATALIPPFFKPDVDSFFQTKSFEAEIFGPIALVHRKD